jgi:DNA-binding transcriptional regulator YiaG
LTLHDADSYYERTMQEQVHPLKRHLRERWPPMSQAKLARLLNMNAAVLNHYLSGRRVPPNGFYAAAATELGVDEQSIRPQESAAAA